MPGSQPLRDFWRARVRTWRGLGPRSNPAVEYQDLAAAGLDYQGQLSSAFGSSGAELAVSVTPDFGDLLLPGLASLAVTVGASGSRVARTMVVLTRLPSAVTAGAGTWRCTNPVSLQVLEGRAWSLGLSGTVEAGLEPPFDTDELGVELAIGVSASAGATGTMLQLFDPAPVALPSPMSGEASLQASLGPALDAVLGLSKADAKAEIDAWIVARVARLIDSTPPSEPVDSGSGSTLSKLTPKLSQVADLLKAKAIASLDTAINKVLAPTGAAIKTPGLQALVDAWNKPKTDALLDKLASLRQGIEALDAATLSPRARRAELAQIDAYCQLLRRFQALSAPAATGPYAALCFYRQVSIEGCFDATAAAEATTSLPVAEDAAPQPVTLDLGATATANTNGRARRVSYRYQCFTAGSTGVLVRTQDTNLTYRRVTLSAEATASLGISVGSFAKARTATTPPATWEYRTMTYQSVHAGWILPPPGGTGKVSVTPTSSSGVVFGLSVGLVRLAKSTAKGATSGLLKSLARQLRVPVDALLAFLQECQLAELVAPPTEGATDASAPDAAPTSDMPEAVFLEAAFVFDDTVTLSASPKGKKAPRWRLGDPLREPSVRRFISGLRPTKPTPSTSTTSAPAKASPQLESLRLRARISDVVITRTPLFTLGLDLGSAAEFNLGAVSSAGHEGFFDLHVQWVKDPSGNQPEDALAAQERSVPPVALLHHEPVDEVAP